MNATIPAHVMKPMLSAVAKESSRYAINGTTRQIERRPLDLGASDCAAVCGVDPYVSAWDVWARKTGLVVMGGQADGQACGRCAGPDVETT